MEEHLQKIFNFRAQQYRRRHRHPSQGSCNVQRCPKHNPFWTLNADNCRNSWACMDAHANLQAQCAASLHLVTFAEYGFGRLYDSDHLSRDLACIPAPLISVGLCDWISHGSRYSPLQWCISGYDKVAGYRKTWCFFLDHLKRKSDAAWVAVYAGINRVNKKVVRTLPLRTR